MARKKDAPASQAPASVPEDVVDALNTSLAAEEPPWDEGHQMIVTETQEPIPEAYEAQPPTPDVTVAAPEPPAPEPPAPVPSPTPEPPDTGKPVSRVAEILRITTEARLVAELHKFEDSVYAQIRPLRVLLSKDLHANEITSVQNHMTDVERWREKVLRWSSLLKTFVAHCKSDHFILKREQGMKITEFDREAYQKRLLAGFLGLDHYLEGLVETIDSRVNMAKVLLRLDEAGQYHPGARERTS